MNKKTYISGKITGLPLSEARELFSQASEFVKAMGLIPVNPMEATPFVEGKTWSEYMLEDIKLLLGCENIFMIPNYKESKGARIEFAIAEELNLFIIYGL